MNPKPEAGETRPPKQRQQPPFPEPAPELKWYERLNALNITMILFLLATVISTPVLQGSGRNLQYFENFARFLSAFFPPDFSVLPEAIRALRESIQIAVMATFFSIIISFPLAAASSQNIAPRWLVLCARMVMNFIRTIPSLIWALIAVVVVGANPLAGVVALTIYSIGYLGKFFSDAFESLDTDIAKGLRAIGADPVQAFQHGMWPHAKPLVCSYALWMLEYNIRAASIIGYVGAGGVGLLLHSYQEFRMYDKFATVLLLILVVVTTLDFAGEWVRRQVTKRINNKALASR
ncbi:MAG TPA: phosphonate ABC transporter, permease protein PhnE [Opitutales bacterium]|nr:phosphonate ABC transporter, permease protein PhnE [Opitutales bacterium]